MGAEYVETTGSGSVSVVPDQALLHFRFVHQAAEVAPALEACAATVRAVLVVLDETAGEGHVRQTGSISVSDHWDEQRQRTSGYEATQTLTVRLPDPARIGAVIAVVSTAAGPALRMEGLDWAATEVDDARRRARDLAFARARDTADQLARLGGRTLGPLLRVREGGGHHDGPVSAVAKMAFSVDASMPAEAGESEVRVDLTARWLLSG